MSMLSWLGVWCVVSVPPYFATCGGPCLCTPQPVGDCAPSPRTQRHVSALCIFYKINSNSHRYLFSELPSATIRVRHTRAAAASHPLAFEISRCRTSQFARCFLTAHTRVVCGMAFPIHCIWHRKVKLI